MKTNGSTNARTPVSCYLSSWNVRLSLYFSTRPRLPNTDLDIKIDISEKKKEKKRKNVIFIHSNYIPNSFHVINTHQQSITFALHPCIIIPLQISFYIKFFLVVSNVFNPNQIRSPPKLIKNYLSILHE